MGACCSYVLKFDHNTSVADPITVNEIQQVCDTELKNKSSKKSPKNKKTSGSSKKETIPKNGGLILSTTSPTKNQYTNPSPIKTSEEMKFNIVKDEKSKTITNTRDILTVEPSQNIYLQGNGSRTVESNPNHQTNLLSTNLNPNDILRKDGRALTSRADEKASNEKKIITKNTINLEELKIGDEIIKKITKLNTISKNTMKDMEDGINSPIRSQTQGNENALFDEYVEGTGNTKKDEIKKSLIETKENLEKKLEKNPSKQLITKEDEQLASKDRIKSSDKRANDSPTKHVEPEKISPMPRKSLLKRYKTSGDEGKAEKSKKKVKFKDLFDAKGKKKSRSGRKKP